MIKELENYTKEKIELESKKHCLIKLFGLW